ncbi:MAG: 2-C-methyl-D-erythritol 4-phosphate cytidylyltransferase [Chloroherpetonaceae bacterium]|nr:2-C-methyl-D-erythritol 4-phosphate cytidylyltransferase [Chloroherpetonaceae bacterium]MDW8436990.1 2-C-methyl-D-erythritol 4-phosphate cytidylyltransferase [Chloroherpetonaceae bacterium]
MNALVVVAAGGMGTRMNLKEGKSKQYLKLGRHPVLRHAIKAFEKCAFVSSIAVATSASHLHELARLANRARFKKTHHFLQGGKERQDSIFNCIEVFAAVYRGLPDETRRETVILIHDGARPLIQPSDIERIAENALRFGAAVPATKPKDTIKFVDESGEFFGETLDRNRLRQVQTPQGFRAELIIEAHFKAKAEGFYATDDAALVERYFPEQKIKVVETGYHNVKITTPEDMDIAKAIMKRLKASQQ